MIQIHSFGDMTYLKSDKDLEPAMVIGCVLSFYLRALAHEVKNVTSDMMMKLVNNIGEVFVLTFLTRENARGVQIAASSIVCKKKVKIVLTMVLTPKPIGQCCHY